MDTRSQATRYQADQRDIVDAAKLRARAARIRERSQLLVESLGPDHPLVAQALNKARHFEAQAEGAEIHLR